MKTRENINLLRNVINVNSAARNLNLHILNNNISIHGSLVDRVKKICDNVNLNFLETIFDSGNVNDVFQTFTRRWGRLHRLSAQHSALNICWQGVVEAASPLLLRFYKLWNVYIVNYWLHKMLCVQNVLLIRRYCNKY